MNVMTDAAIIAADPDSTESVSVHERLNRGDLRMTRIETLLAKNCTDTAEVLDIMRMGKSFFRAIGYVGRFIKWAAAVIAPLVAVYLTWREHR